MQKCKTLLSLAAMLAALALSTASQSEAGGLRGKKASANGTKSSQMMRLGGPRSASGRASTFDAGNTGYGEFGSVAFARGEQRFDGVSVRQLYLKQSRDGSGK